MTTRPAHPAGSDKGKTKASGAAPEPQPGGFALSPGIGPVLAVYVPGSPGQASAVALTRHAVTGAGRLTHCWAAGLRYRVPDGRNHA